MSSKQWYILYSILGLWDYWLNYSKLIIQFWLFCSGHVASKIAMVCGMDTPKLSLLFFQKHSRSYVTFTTIVRWAYIKVGLNFNTKEQYWCHSIATLWIKSSRGSVMNRDWKHVSNLYGRHQASSPQNSFGVNRMGSQIYESNVHQFKCKQTVHVSGSILLMLTRSNAPSPS